MNRIVFSPKTTVLVAVLFISANSASAYYDPGMQRWLNRDPLGEKGFGLVTRNISKRRGIAELMGGPNLYEFVGNAPIWKFDPKGLTVWVCSRKTTWGVGNHTYFYNDDPSVGSGMCQSCGTTTSSGSGSPCGNEKGPFPWDSGSITGEVDSCQPVPDSDGSRGDSLMNCCQKNANKGIYAPGIHDCHNLVNDCLTQNGFAPHGNPRFGPPRVGPMNSN